MELSVYMVGVFLLEQAELVVQAIGQVMAEGGVPPAISQAESGTPSALDQEWSGTLAAPSPDDVPVASYQISDAPTQQGDFLVDTPDIAQQPPVVGNEYLSQQENVVDIAAHVDTLRLDDDPRLCRLNIPSRGSTLRIAQAD